MRPAALGSAMLIADALISHSLTQSAHAPALPFLATDRFSQKKIFEDELAVTGRKRSTANAAGRLIISSLRFNPLIERVAVQAVEMNCRVRGHDTDPPPKNASSTEQHYNAAAAISPGEEGRAQFTARYEARATKAKTDIALGI